VSQLPPPPPGSLPPQPSPWTPAAAATSQLPPWRTAKVGWVILHIVIGMAIGFGVFFVAMIVIAAGHFDLETVNRVVQANRNTTVLPAADQRMLAALGGAFLMALAAGVLAWLLFVYLRARTIVRIAVLIAIPAVAALISYGMIASVLPKLAGY